MSPAYLGCLAPQPRQLLETSRNLLLILSTVRLVFLYVETTFEMHFSGIYAILKRISDASLWVRRATKRRRRETGKELRRTLFPVLVVFSYVENIFGRAFMGIYAFIKSFLDVGL